jgi:putative inorganic carbon (hco3(-)) transporter
MRTSPRERVRALPRGSSRSWPFRTDILVLVLIAIQPIESALPLAANGVSITKIAGVLCILAFTLDVLATGRRVRLDASHALLAGLLAVGLLSSIVARSQPMAIETLARYTGFVALYVIVTQFFGDHRQKTRIVWVLTCAASVAALLALWNFFSGRTLLATLTYGDPNDLGYVLATTVPLSVWLARRTSASRIVAIMMVAVILTGLALTLSRGAIVALAIGVAWIVITEPRSRKALVAAALVATVAGVVFLLLNEARVKSAVSVKGRVASENVQSRIELWRAATILTVEHPVLGVGPGNFPLYQLETQDQPQGSVTFVVHNAYLEVAAELGVAGLMLFLAFLAIQWRRLTQATASGAGPPGLSSAVRVSFLVALAGALTLSEEFYAPIWIAAALGTLLWLEGERSDPEQVRDT